MRHVIAAILARGELRDPALAEVTLTLTEVRVSPDLKSATAFVVPLGGGGMDDAHLGQGKIDSGQDPLGRRASANCASARKCGM